LPPKLAPACRLIHGLLGGNRMIDRRREDARKRAIALSESVCPDRPAAIEKPALPAVHTERAALSSSRGATADVVAIARASTKAAALDRQYQKVLHDSCPTSSTGRSSASSERTRRHEATGAFASRGPASRSAETCKADSCWRGRASGDGSFTAGSRMGASSRGSGSRRGMGRGGIGAQSDRYRPGPSG